MVRPLEDLELTRLVARPMEEVELDALYRRRDSQPRGGLARHQHGRLRGHAEHL
jgi:hypothetical protein